MVRDVNASCAKKWSVHCDMALILRGTNFCVATDPQRKERCWETVAQLNIARVTGDLLAVVSSMMDAYMREDMLNVAEDVRL